MTALAQAPHGSLNNSTFNQAGVGAQPESAEVKAREWKSVGDYGAVSYPPAVTSGADSLAAFKACRDASPHCLIPHGQGQYFLSGPFILPNSNTAFSCQDNSTILQSTAASPVDSVITLGSVSGAYEITWDGCLISGNANTPVGLHAWQANHTTIRNVRAKNALTPIFIDTSVSLLLDMPEISNASGENSIVEPTTGIDVFSSNSVEIHVPTVEYIARSQRPAGYPALGSGATATATVSAGVVTVATLTAGGSAYAFIPEVIVTPTGGDVIPPGGGARIYAVLTNGVVTSLTLDYGGLLYAHAPTLSFVPIKPGIGINVRASGAIKVVEGTSESNRIGVRFDHFTTDSKVDTMDNEDNYNYDVEDAGAKNKVDGGLYAGLCLSSCGGTEASIHYVGSLYPGGGRATSGTVEDVLDSIVSIDTDAVGITVERNRMGNNACCIADHGTDTTLENNYNLGAPLQNKFPIQTAFAATIGTNGGSPPLASDDPNGYVGSANFGTDFVRFGTLGGPGGTLPTCDATYGHGILQLYNPPGGFSPQILACMINNAGTAWSMVPIWYDRLGITGLVPGTYGDGSHVPQVVIDNTGNVSSAANVAITQTGITALTGDVTATGPGSAAAVTTGTTITYTGVPTGCTFTSGVPSACTNSTLVFTRGLK